MKKSAALLVSLSLAAGLAWGHGPTRKKVEIDATIAAPPDAVWALIGNFQDMSWHPAVAKTEGQGGNAPGATRIITLVGGGQLAESLDRFDGPGRSYHYRIDQVDPKVLPVTNYAAWVSVAPGPDGTSVVTWKGAFSRGWPNNDPPPGLDDEAAVKAVTQVYQAGLANIKTLAEKPK